MCFYKINHYLNKNKIMALFDEKENYLFIHLYKCGGKSLRKILNDFSLKKRGYQNSNLQANNDKTFGELLGVHCNIMDVKKHYIANNKEDLYNKMFKFTMVRNPFAFLLSTYYYARKHKNHFMHNVVMSIPFSNFPPYYLKIMKQHKTSRPYGSNKVTSLYDWIYDENGNNLFDFVGKLENINTDSKLIMDKINIPYVAVPVLDKNKLNNKPYQQVYNQKTREFVEKHFAKDFEFLDYKW